MSVIPDSRTGAQHTAGPTQCVAVIARERDDRFLRRVIGVNVDIVGEIHLLAVDWRQEKCIYMQVLLITQQTHNCKRQHKISHFNYFTYQNHFATWLLLHMCNGGF